MVIQITISRGRLDDEYPIEVSGDIYSSGCDDEYPIEVTGDIYSSACGSHGIQ